MFMKRLRPRIVSLFCILRAGRLYENKKGHKDHLRGAEGQEKHAYTVLAQNQKAGPGLGQRSSLIAPGPRWDQSAAAIGSGAGYISDKSASRHATPLGRIFSMARA